MKGKTEKAHGAKVRASRAKSRVAAKRKLRAQARRPKRAPAAPATRAPVRGRGEDAAPAPLPGCDPYAGRKKDRAEKKARPQEATLDSPARRGEARKEGKRRKPRRAESEMKRKEPKAIEAGATEAAYHAEDREACEQSQPRKRRDGARTVRIALLGTVLLASLAALLWIYTSTGVLNVKSVEVRGNEVLDAEYLRSLSGITHDTHLLKMDVKAVESALLSEPYIARVDVSRRFPNTVVLEVTERQPTGVIMQNGKYDLLDQEGMVLQSVDTRPPGLVEIKDLELPLLLPGVEISGIDFATVTSLLGSLPTALREMTTAVGIEDGEGLYLESRGTSVIYGEASDLSRKNAIALMALSVLVDRYGAVEYIDVSFPEHPVIKPAPPDQPALEEG